MAKGMSLDLCVKLAEDYIAHQGMCLLLFDVKESRKFEHPAKLMQRLSSMMEDLNQKFEPYFPEHNLAACSRKEKGFQFLLGDGSWTAINSASIIPKIINYQSKNYPNIPLYWAVAKDGYDRERTKIVR
jgi:hypothetical protein